MRAKCLSSVGATFLWEKKRSYGKPKTDHLWSNRKTLVLKIESPSNS